MARIELVTPGRWDPQGPPRIEVDYWARDKPAVLAKVDAWATDITEARAAIATAEARIENVVQQLRSEGASWAVIGHLLGTTKAAAHKRFGRVELATSSTRQPSDTTTPATASTD